MASALVAAGRWVSAGLSFYAWKINRDWQKANQAYLRELAARSLLPDVVERLLQEREYERVGENITRQAEVRIIAATSHDLKQRVAAGAFREDLYFRLNVITAEMPPLRQRQGDLARFAGHYFKHFAALAAGFTPA
jgi:transcriptional regulator of aromatic amino acid metabolism